jgi:hypothetical protein
MKENKKTKSCLEELYKAEKVHGSGSKKSKMAQMKDKNKISPCFEELYTGTAGPETCRGAFFYLIFKIILVLGKHWVMIYR